MNDSIAKRRKDGSLSKKETTIRIEGFPAPPKMKKKSSKFLIIFAIAFVFLMILSVFFFYSGNSFPSSNILSSEPSDFYIYMVADRDEFSKNEESGNWESSVFEGILKRRVNSESGKVSYSYDFTKETLIDSPHVESKGGSSPRGMELSALQIYNGKLYTCCDRTGIIYEIVKGKNQKFVVVPKMIIATGDGHSHPKGMKCEWMAVKHDKLYVGSIGKEWTTKEGAFVSDDPQYVAIIKDGKILSYSNWKSIYNKLRYAVGPDYLNPGYLVHEAVSYNPQNRKWYFLPRRMSKEQYDDQVEIQKGAHIIIEYQEGMDPKVIPINGKTTKFRGFSEMKFIPEFPEEIIALRTEEGYHSGKVNTYMTIVNIHGEVLMEETFLKEDKLEGLEITEYQNRLFI